MVRIGVLSFGNHGSKNGATQRSGGSERGIPYSRRLSCFVQHGSEKLAALFGCVMLRRDVETKFEQVPRLESRIDILHAIHAAYEQSCAGQGNQRQRNFTDHKSASQMAASKRFRSTASAALQNFAQVRK